MPVQSDSDPHSDWPDRTPLYDDYGRLLLVFTLASSTRDGRPWADGAWRPADVTVPECRDAILDAMSGYAFSTGDPALADALLRSGATSMRHAHSMSHPLVDLPAPTPRPTIQVEPLSSQRLLANVDTLGAANFRAYPPGHADHEHDTVESATNQVREIALGQTLGPYLDISQVAFVGSAAVGACLIVHREGDPPEGGPWIIDVFRDPAVEVPGIGRALLTQALHAARQAGLRALSLAVSHENASARMLYERLGFVDAGESVTVAVP